MDQERRHLAGDPRARRRRIRCRDRGAHWPVTDTFAYGTLAAALAAPPRPGAEGLVVRYIEQPPQRLVKIKQDDYVALHRIVTGLSERTVWQHMTDGRPLAELLDGLPDELHTWTRDV